MINKVCLNINIHIVYSHIHPKMTSRFSALKPNPQNTFKSGSEKSRPSLNSSKKEWNNSYKSDYDRNISSNKPKKYVSPAMRMRTNRISSFNTYRQGSPAFVPIPTFKEKDGDFPTIGSCSDIGETVMTNFANIVKNKETPLEEVKREINPVPPGWIRWRRLNHSNKWIEERGPESKDHKRFIKWIDEFNEYRRFIAFEEYLERLREEELEELELNGPVYINSWEISLDKPDYDSDPEIHDKSDSEDDEEEFIHINDFY